MVKPVILAVDDDPQVLQAPERDLRRLYALDPLGKLKLRGDPMAHFFMDQCMLRMTGVEFLQEGIERFPDTKRVPLTAYYSDTETAIRATNELGLDSKPGETRFTVRLPKSN